MHAAARIALALFLALPASAQAQNGPAPISGPRATPLFAAGTRGPLAQPLARDKVDPAIREIQATHWQKGAIIGGLGAGLLLGAFNEGMCRMESRDCGGAFMAGFVGGGVLGGILGALVGGQFPKD